MSLVGRAHDDNVTHWLVLPVLVPALLLLLLLLLMMMISHSDGTSAISCTIIIIGP